MYLHYRPGCSRQSCHTNSDGKRSCHTVPTDCKVMVLPHQYTKIHTAGNADKLCATHDAIAADDDVFARGFECVTKNGLKHDYHWCVGNSLSFSRCDGPQDTDSTNSTSNAYPFPVNFTADEWNKSDIISTASQDYVQSNLRGTSTK